MQRRFNSYDIIPIEIPVYANLLLAKNDEQYSRVIGSLMYNTNGTHLDIAYAVNKLSNLYTRYTIILDLSNSGYEATIGGGDMSWKSMKQKPTKESKF